MNDKNLLVVRLACALGLTLSIHGCREDLGCPPGTVLVGDVCEAAPDAGPPSQDAALSCDETCDACDGRAELCDGEDNDCDGRTDEDSDVTCGTDVGECSSGTRSCVDGELGECDGAVAPAPFEVCEGSLDENCDGEVDEDCECALGDTRPCGVDTGECSQGIQTCTAERVYGDCDGVGPAVELCNGLDDDCDGVVDNGNPGGGAACGTDLGECVAGVETCAEGEVVCANAVGPQEEVCNGRDDDCSGMVDEGVTATFYRDQDSDGRGTPALTMAACSVPVGYVANAQDCDDGCEFCWTGAPELCDGLNNDCDGGTDEGVTTRFYLDADGDSYGTASTWLDACAPPTDYVTNTNDCDDECEVCWIGNADVCDGEDNNCSGTADENSTCQPDASVPCTTSCGTAGIGACTAACGIPVGAACLPPSESCNTIDDDCDGVSDEGTQTFGDFNVGPLSHASKLVRSGSGYIGITRYSVRSRLYATDAVGTVTHSEVVVEEEDVVDVDLARISDTQWVSASAFGAGSVNVHLVGMSQGVPTVSDMERAQVVGTGGVARVAANASNDAMVVFRSGSVVRVSHVDFSGSTAATTTLAGTNPRPELGVDIAARGVGQGYVVAWVTGTTPSVNVALVSAPSMTITSHATVGAGSNPSVAVNTLGNVAVAYAGPDGRLRYHHLTSSLDCVTGGARSTCPISPNERTINTPVGATHPVRTIDMEADGLHFWLVARTSEGEMVLRLGDRVHDDIFRVNGVSTRMNVAVRNGVPLISRGGGTGLTHDLLACP